MESKQSSCPVIIFLALSAILGLTSIAKASTVIYHNPNSSGILNANLLYNLAGHFDEALVLADVTEYQAGDLDDYTHSIYLCAGSEATLPVTFLADVGTGLHRIFWIDCNFDQLANYLGGSGPFGFRNSGWVGNTDRNRIYYKDRMMLRTDDLSHFSVQVTGEAQILAELTSAAHPGNRVPYCLHSGNLFYLVDNPLYSMGIDDRHWVLTDLLHEFFESGVQEEKYAMVRLEDLAPSNVVVDNLELIADWFYERDIPFSFGVIPVFLDPLGTYHGGVPFEAHFADDPDFVSAIHYMLARGGTMLMHGITHQHGNQITGNGWEFIDDQTMNPLPEDGEDWVRSRIEWGLEEFAGAGFRPRIWETPHYVASHGTYHIVAEFFETQYERIQTYDLPPDDPAHWQYQGISSCQIMPNFVMNNVYGMNSLPETIGYLSQNETGYTPQDLLNHADHISIVRDVVPSFYFHHSYVELSWLFEVAQGLLNRGYTFVGPDHFVDHRTDPWLDDDDDTGDDDTGDDDTGDDDTGDDDTGDDDTGDDDTGDDDTGDDDTGDDDTGDDDTGDDDDANNDDDDDDDDCGF